MYRFFVENANKIEENIYIKGDQYNHIKNALRKQIGDKIEVVIEDKVYLCKIIDFLEDAVELNIIEEKNSKNESNINIHFCQSIPKSDKPESIFQRAVELGSVEIIPFISNRTIVKFNAESKRKKKERFEKIVKSSSQQSKRDIIPLVSEILEFNELLLKLKDKTIFLAYEGGGQNIKDALKEVKDDDIYVVIGPEGGFEESEVKELIEIGAKVITLGERILRVETAGISLVSIIQYELGDM